MRRYTIQTIFRFNNKISRRYSGPVNIKLLKPSWIIFGRVWETFKLIMEFEVTLQTWIICVCYVLSTNVPYQHCGLVNTHSKWIYKKSLILLCCRYKKNQIIIRLDNRKQKNQKSKLHKTKVKHAWGHNHVATHRGSHGVMVKNGVFKTKPPGHCCFVRSEHPH